MKITNKSLKPILEIERKVENSVINYPVIKIRYNTTNKNIIAVVYDDGILDIIHLSDEFSENKYDEVNRLNYLINHF